MEVLGRERKKKRNQGEQGIAGQTGRKQDGQHRDEVMSLVEEHVLKILVKLSHKT